jgi:hypothetical protein
MFEKIKKVVIMNKIDKIIKEMMPDDLLDETIKKFVSQHRAYFKSEKVKSFQPMMVVGAVNMRDNWNMTIDHHLIGFDVPEGITKAEVFNRLGSKFRESQENSRPLFTMWVAEAWLGKDKSVAPSKDKDRKSVLITSLLTADGRERMCMQEISDDRKLHRARYGKDNEKSFDKVGAEFWRGWVGKKSDLK